MVPPTLKIWNVTFRMRNLLSTFMIEADIGKDSVLSTSEILKHVAMKRDG
jgi:hypothetical protein